MSLDTEQYIRVTKQFDFEMAHALLGYDGPCKNIHGHTYQLRVTLLGKAIQQANNPKDGMMLDFGVLKKVVCEKVISKFDHALVLNKNTPQNTLGNIQEHFENIVLLPFQPTCENMLLHIKDLLNETLPSSHYKLFALRLDETQTSYAEWFLSDNAKTN